jgi:hypothetical protein
MVDWERQLYQNLKLAKMLNRNKLKAIKLKLSVATAKSPK